MTNTTETSLQPMDANQTGLIPYGDVLNITLLSSGHPSTALVAKSLNTDFPTTITRMQELASEYPYAFVIDPKLASIINSIAGTPEGISARIPSLEKAISGRVIDEALKSEEMKEFTDFNGKVTSLISEFDGPATFIILLGQIAVDNRELAAIDIDTNDISTIRAAHSLYVKLTDLLFDNPDVNPDELDLWIRSFGQILGVRSMPFREKESGTIAERRRDFDILFAQARQIQHLMRLPGLDNGVLDSLRVMDEENRGRAIQGYPEFMQEIIKLWGQEGNVYDQRAWQQDPTQGTSNRELSEIYHNPND